jgi:plastocyanin
MKKFLVFLILLCIGAYATYYYQNKNVAQAPEVENKTVDFKKSIELKTESQKQINPPVVTTPKEAEKVSDSPVKKAEGIFSDGSEVDGPDIAVVEVSYDGFVYSPNSVNIKQGDFIFFKNKSKDKFWPASNPHPIHDTYSDFDPKKPIDSNGSWKFQFAEVGTWKFHDHLNPSARGVVNVNAR